MVEGDRAFSRRRRAPSTALPRGTIPERASRPPTSSVISRNGRLLLRAGDDCVCGAARVGIAGGAGRAVDVQRAAIAGAIGADHRLSRRAVAACLPGDEMEAETLSGGALRTGRPLRTRRTLRTGRADGA